MARFASDAFCHFPFGRFIGTVELYETIERTPITWRSTLYHIATLLLTISATSSDGDEQVARNFALHQAKIKRALFDTFPIYILADTKASGAAYLKAKRIQVKLLQVQHQQLENVLFILWRNVEYLTRAPTKTRRILFGASEETIENSGVDQHSSQVSCGVIYKLSRLTPNLALLGHIFNQPFNSYHY